MTSIAALVGAIALSLALRFWLERDEDLGLSPRYRFVPSALIGFVAALIAWRTGFSRDLLVSSEFLTLVLLAAACNTEVGLFPDRLTLPGILLGCLSCPWLVERTGYDGVLGALAGGATALLLRTWSKGGVGLGDVKMLAMIGAFVGPGIKPILVEIFVVLVASVPFWLLVAHRRESRAMVEVNAEPPAHFQQTGIPTGPAYAAAVLVHVLFEPDLARLIPFWPNGNAWW